MPVIDYAEKYPEEVEEEGPAPDAEGCYIPTSLKETIKKVLETTPKEENSGEIKFGPSISKQSKPNQTVQLEGSKGKGPWHPYQYPPTEIYKYSGGHPSCAGLVKKLKKRSSPYIFWTVSYDGFANTYLVHGSIWIDGKKLTSSMTLSYEIVKHHPKDAVNLVLSKTSVGLGKAIVYKEGENVSQKDSNG